MESFGITADGRLVDSNVLKTMERLRKDVPDLDEAAVESHFMLFRSYHVFYTTLASRYEELGLSISRFKMLLSLYNHDGRMTISELGAGIDASVPNVVRMVPVLEGLGWVQRFENPEDRRVTFVELTDDGLAKFRALLPRALEIWEDVWSGLDPAEKLLLNHLLTKLRMSLLSRYVPDDVLPYVTKPGRRARSSAAR